MSTAPSTVERLRPYSVPAGILAIVAIAIVAVPPLLLGDAGGETYALTVAWLFLAFWATMPYALVVGLATLPLCYGGVATYASPGLLPGAGESATAGAVVRHFLAGFGYALAAGVVGAIGIGADIATATEAGSPPFVYLAGGVVGACFVALQLWRHDATPGDVDTTTIVGTAALGVPLVVAGRAAVWLFQAGLQF